MRPFIDKRINPNYRHAWKHSHKLQYSFNKRGCRNLKALNNYKSKNHPIGTSLWNLMKSEKMTTAVLPLLIILKNLKALKWENSGGLLQYLQIVYEENRMEPPKLELSY